MAISRMQEPRQLYGLGSLVKSIGKTIKKVVKSPVGKGLLLAGGLGLAGIGPFSGLARTGVGQALFGGATKFLPANAIKGAAVSKPGLFGMAKNFLGSTAGKFAVGGALTSMLAASGMGAEEIEETKRDPEKLKIYLRDYISKTNPDFTDDQVEEQVNINVSEYAVGGRVGLMGGAMPTGIMRANKAGTIERDYRETGGFVPVGIKEKADDVPAMLSKNEFVMTADAVRGIGDGNIEKGAQRLYDQMKTAEKRVV